MPRRKGTPNTPQIIIDEIVAKHQTGVSIRPLSAKYKKPIKTIKNMITRENKKRRKVMADQISKPRGRKPAKTLQEYKYENKRLKMENELLRDFLSLTERK